MIPVRQYPSAWTLGSGIVQTASLRRDLRQSLRTRQPVAGLRQRMAVAPAVVTPAPDRLLFVCANRVVTTRRQPVVTTRTTPQPTRTYWWLARVTTASDGLPDPSSSRAAQRGSPSARFPNGRRLTSRATRAPQSPGSMAHLDGTASSRKAPSTPRAGAAAASSKGKSAQTGSGVPGPS